MSASTMQVPHDSRRGRDQLRRTGADDLGFQHGTTVDRARQTDCHVLVHVADLSAADQDSNCIRVVRVVGLTTKQSSSSPGCRRLVSGAPNFAAPNTQLPQSPISYVDQKPSGVLCEPEFTAMTLQTQRWQSVGTQHEQLIPTRTRQVHRPLRGRGVIDRGWPRALPRLALGRRKGTPSPMPGNPRHDQSNNAEQKSREGIHAPYRMRPTKCVCGGAHIMGVKVSPIPSAHRGARRRGGRAA